MGPMYPAKRANEITNGIIQSDTNSIVHFLEGVVLCQNKQSIAIHLARILLSIALIIQWAVSFWFKVEGDVS